MIHLLWKLTPVIWLGLFILVVALIWRVTQGQRLLRSLTVAVFSLVWVWLPLHGLAQEVNYSVSIPGYQVTFFERADRLFFDVPRYFEVTRDDGKQASFQLDIDAYRCVGLQTQTIGAKTYFRCGGEPISETVDYLDAEALTLYSGWSQEEVEIGALSFE